MNKDKYNEFIKLIRKFNFDNLTEKEKDKLIYTPLFEQAFGRKVIKNAVIDLGWQIMENLCLILFMSRYRENVLTINHWKTELYAHCSKIAKLNVKIKNKTKTLEYSFFDEADFSEADVIFEGIADKFADENVDVYQEQYAVYDIIEDAQDILKNDLIPVMLNRRTLSDLKNYIYELN